MKKTTIISLVIIQVAILLLSACGQKGPLPPSDKIPPKVSLISPTNGAQNVPVNCSVMITFSEDMAASTINEQTITLSTGNGNVQGSVTYAGMTAVFKPAADLNPGTIYTVTVDGSVADEAGNAMETPFGYIFITGAAQDTTPPGVSATNPAKGTLNVSVNAAIGVIFSEPVDQSTITFTLSAGGATVPCTMTYAGTTAIFTPSAMLAYGTQYTAAVKSGIVDMAGNPMPSDYGWTFTTGAQPDTTPPSVIANTPKIGATNVSVNTSLNVTFSEAVNQSTITFTLSAGGTNVPCTMTYSGTTAIFTPTSPLSYNTLYTATVSSGVKDLAGNPMPSSYFWSFTTGIAPDTTPPSVIGTTPGSGANNIVPNTAISVTFSEAVDQSTITFTLSAGGTTVPCTMTYSGTTAIFTPSAMLAYGTQYTAIVKAGVTDLANNAMASDYGWTFTTGAHPDTTPPSVTANTPGIGATNVSVNTSLNVTFSEAVNQSTITFTLSAGGTNVPCTMTYSGTTAIFTPTSPLSYNTLYTATVSSGVKDLAGNPMPSSYFWSFTTGIAPDTTPPSVIGTTPGSGANNIVPNTAISVTFSEAVDQSTITFTLSAGGTTVPCTMTYSGTTAIFTPSAMLAYGTQYTATVKSGVADMAGNPMPSDYGWTFTTGAQPDTTPPSVIANTPGIGATNVSVNTSLNVTFSEAVNQSTITFTLSAGGTNVPCTMTYSGTTAIFTPTSPLSYNTLYTATVSSGVKDLAGNPMPSSYFWSFTTGIAPDTTPPSVIGTTPGSGANNIVPNTAISVTFSEAVDQSTITFTLSAGGTTVPCTMTYSGTTAIFTPSAMLAYGTQYTAIVKAGVTDLANNAMASDYGWTFTTGTAPDTTPPSVSATTPASNATNVDPNATLSVTFSEAVNQSTITFTLSTGSATVPCTMTYSGMTAIFRPSSALAYDTLYTARVTAGVQDLAGNAMTTDYVWGFQTASPPVLTYTITATADTNGTISPSGSVSVVQGATQLFTITPNPTYHIVTVGGTCGGTLSVDATTGVGTYTTNAVSGDCSVQASFADTFTITATAGPHGHITPLGTVLVRSGADQIFTIRSDAKHDIADVLVDGASVGAIPPDIFTYTFLSVTANHTISASFI